MSAAEGYCCPDCLRWFAAAEQLRRHQDSSHQGQIVPKPPG